MRYIALATDYDETLADEGTVRPEVVEALERLRESGRRLVLVTGRELPELQSVCDRLDLFEYVVAENGGLLYQPSTKLERPLGAAPDERFLLRLRERGVTPLSSGHVIVATREPHQTEVLDAIRELGLELQVIFNKGAVMVLPSAVNKASGLAVALMEMGISPHNLVAVGDGENDHALLAMAEAAVAVANAVPTLRERADLVTDGRAGAGIIELANALVADDLSAVAHALTRHHVLLGLGSEGAEVSIEPYGAGIMIAGTSGSGKSTLTMGLLERFAQQGYEFCLIDPEGDYGPFADAVLLGDKDHAPTLDEIIQVLDRPGVNVIVNMLGVILADRPAFFDSLVLRMHELRTRAARPHWLVVDEAHHMLQPPLSEVRVELPAMLENIVMITPHPEMLAEQVIARVDTLITVGDDISRTVNALARALRVTPPEVPAKLEPGEALVWSPRRRAGTALRVRMEPAHAERRRHERKYAEGELGPEQSFYFRGRDEQLNLRAQNLMMFMQIADGLDADTWQYHLARGDYSRWFREMIKDEELAADGERVEHEHGLTADESRHRMRTGIESRYTLPSTAPTGSSKEEPE